MFHAYPLRGQRAALILLLLSTPSRLRQARTRAPADHHCRLDAVEREGPWLTNRVRPGKLILGRLGDIETGLRQLAAS